jgi:hypothetical protein
LGPAKAAPLVRNVAVSSAVNVVFAIIFFLSSQND